MAYRTLYPTIAEYNIDFKEHKTVTKADHIQGHYTRLNTLKKKKTQYIKKSENLRVYSFDQIGIKLEIRNNKVSRKISNYWKINNPWQKKLQRKSENISTDNENSTSKSLEHI